MAPPAPFLSRFNVWDVDEKAKIIDRFFWWYSHFPTNHAYREAATNSGLFVVEVICHGRKTTGDQGDDDQEKAAETLFCRNCGAKMGPLYFVEDSVYQGAFESIRYEKGQEQRSQGLELLNSTLLKCKRHGTSWEVNVLGQKQEKHEVEEMKDIMWNMENRLRKLEVEAESLKTKEMMEELLRKMGGEKNLNVSGGS